MGRIPTPEQQHRKLFVKLYSNTITCIVYSKGSVLSKSFSILKDFSLAVKAATLIFISGCSSAISSAKEGKSGFIYNLVKN